ncbi:transmembrane protein 176B-like [Gastrophryne carolinensis]
MGAVSVVNTENGKVSCETPEGTVVNININQRSALDCMLDVIKAYRIPRKDGGQKKPAGGTRSALPLGIGVSFISVGFLSVVLAVIFAVARPSLIMFYTSTHFWVGFPLIAGGALNIVSYRYPNPFWVVMAFISLLACLGVSIAGLVFTINDINAFGWLYNTMSQCDELIRSVRNQDQYVRYNPRTEPPRYYDSDNYNYQLEECKRTMRAYQSTLCGLVIMSLLIMIWGICASVLTLGYRLKVIYTACKCEKPEEEDNDEALLSPNPPSEDLIV